MYKYSKINRSGKTNFEKLEREFWLVATLAAGRIGPIHLKAGFTSECEQNAACENDAYIYAGKFVHCSVFSEAANRPCSQAVRSLMQMNWQHWKPVIAKCKKNDVYI